MVQLTRGGSAVIRNQDRRASRVSRRKAPSPAKPTRSREPLDLPGAKRRGRHAEGVVRLRLGANRPARDVEVERHARGRGVVLLAVQVERQRAALEDAQELPGLGDSNDARPSGQPGAGCPGRDAAFVNGGAQPGHWRQG